MTIFFTADLHFGHRNISRYSGRPYPDTDDGVTEMNEDLITRWNSVVLDDDEVWILGDLCMGRIDHSLALIKRLNGAKYLMPGNHDRCWPHDSPKVQEWRWRYYDAGIDWITETDRGSLSMTAFSAPGAVTPEAVVRLSHFPPAGDTHDFDRFADHRPLDRDGVWFLHGHVHEKWRVKGRWINVGVDAWDGYPVALGSIVDIITHNPRGIDLDPLPWLPLTIGHP